MFSIAERKALLLNRFYFSHLPHQIFLMILIDAGILHSLDSMSILEIFATLKKMLGSFF